MMKSVFLRRIISIFLISIITGVKSLECYSCYYGSSHKACNENTETCSSGQVCYTAVHRHDILYKRFFKGCKAATDCYDLQKINRNCHVVPNQCTYCCQTDRCNVGGASSLHLSIFCLLLPTLLSTLIHV